MLKFTISIFLLGTSLSGQSQGSYSENVFYRGQHDTGWIEFTDDRHVKVQLGRISIEEVDKWPMGKRLTIVYTRQDGVVLADPETGKFLPVLSGLGQHPIDLILKKCLDLNLTTQGMVECHDEATASWTAEMNRHYTELRTTLSADQGLVLQGAQERWVAFSAAQVKAIAELDREGTVSRISRAAAVMGLVREQALRLVLFRSLN